MRDGPLSLLWLCGSPGAGKSTVGWALYEGLVRSGARVGFADIDQLGMCFPAPPGDPERYLLKSHNTSAVARNFQAAGCAAAVVNGNLGTAPRLSLRPVPGASLTICRLRASPGELRRRLTSRRESPDFVAAALRQAEELDGASFASFADACVGTDGLTVAEVARLVRERCCERPPERAGDAGADGTAAGDAGLTPADGAGAAAGADGEVLLVCGATGAGKSAVGFDVFLRQLRAGVAAAYVDLGQIGFMSPVPDERAAAGYASALPAARVTVCRLHAGPDDLARRIALRGQGLSWPEPGDPLIGQPEAHLRRVAEQSAAEAEALERSGLGDLRIDTGGRIVAEVADLIAGRW